jgi:hypothetical protein
VEHRQVGMLTSGIHNPNVREIALVVEILVDESFTGGVSGLLGKEVFENLLPNVTDLVLGRPQPETGGLLLHLFSVVLLIHVSKCSRFQFGRTYHNQLERWVNVMEQRK